MKKFMTILATLAVALMLVGCAKLGDVQTYGTKWKKTFILNGTKPEVGEDDNSRGFAALSASKKCWKISTTIKVPKGDDNIVSAEGKKSVIGLAFDVHETKENNKSYYDFVLVGVKPSDGQFYVEKYTKISKDDLKEDMITEQSAIGNATRNNSTGASFTDCDGKTSGNWASSTVDIEEDDESYSWTITVTQDTAGTYIVKNGNKELGSYTRSLTNEETKSTDKKAYGQIFTYGNAPYGTKIKAIFESDKTATVGLFAEEEDF